MLIDVLEELAGPHLQPFCTMEILGLARYVRLTGQWQLPEDEQSPTVAVAHSPSFSLRYLWGRALPEDTEARIVDRLESGDDCGRLDGFQWHLRAPVRHSSAS
ncbi:MAG TPA: hypothetical protein VFA18_13670 [Gemmataceae bacterium]|nr:hypothetical protein [Gemmataceae bacterium]